MKIAVWHNLPSGGGKRALYDHVRGLIAQGHTVEFWCPPTADQKFLPLSSLIKEHIVDLAWPRPFSLTNKIGITREIKASLVAMDAHCQVCANEMSKGDFEILFANTCQFFRAPPIGRFATIPAILYLQEPYRWFYEALPRLPWLPRPKRTASRFKWSTLKADILHFRTIRNGRIEAAAEIENATAFSKILANSYFSRESILRAYGLDLTVCYLGIDAQRFIDTSLEREDFIVGLGSITPEKNIRLCIEAIGLMSQPRPGLVWIGNMTNDNYLCEMRMLAESRNVQFIPSIGVTDDEVIATLNRAFAMVYAPRLEPFGLAPLEANACGTPVIAVAEAGVRETIVDRVTGVLVENNAAAVADAISRLRADPLWARQLGANGRINVEKKWGLPAAWLRLEKQLFRYRLER